MLEHLLSAQFWEVASYVVTVFGFPFAILVFRREQQKERQNEEAEIYQKLSDDYADFSKVLLQNADLKLMSAELPDDLLTENQRERKKIIFDILISIFERSFILVYQEVMNPQTNRLWSTWDDYIRSWCKRRDFRDALPELLLGEDPDFSAYIRRVAAEESLHTPPNSVGS